MESDIVIAIAIKELFKKGKSDSEMAEILHISEGQVNRARLSLGLRRREKFILLSKSQKLYIEKYSTTENWKTSRELADILRIKPRVVKRYRSNEGLWKSKRYAITEEEKKDKVLIEAKEIIILKNLRRRLRKWEKLFHHLNSCPICGKLTLNKKFCSVECRKKYRRKMMFKYENICESCGTKFKSKEPNRKFCSPKCYRKHIDVQKKRVSSTSRIFAEFICLLRENNHKTYQEIHKLFREKDDDFKTERFDKRLAKFHKKIYGKSYRQSVKLVSSTA